MKIQELHIESSQKARLTYKSESAPLYIQGDALIKGSFHTFREIILHESRIPETEENALIYPGSIRFRDGNFFGFCGEERGWVNWTEPILQIEKRFEVFKQQIEKRNVWKPFWASYNQENTNTPPSGWAFDEGSIAIGKPFSSGNAILEVGGDALFDRKLYVKNMIHAEGGLRLYSHHSTREGSLRFHQGHFEGYNGEEWVLLDSSSPHSLNTAALLEPNTIHQQIQKSIRETVPALLGGLSSEVEYATKSYVDRMISVGMVWLPVLDRVYFISHQEASLTIAFPNGTDSFSWTPPNQQWEDETMNWTVQMRLWFVTDTKPHYHISMVEIQKIIPPQTTDAHWLIHFQRIQEDPLLSLSDFQEGLLYGVLVKDPHQSWWIQKTNRGTIDIGQFQISFPQPSSSSSSFYVQEGGEHEHAQEEETEDESGRWAQLRQEWTEQAEQNRSLLSILETRINLIEEQTTTQQGELQEGVIQSRHIQNKSIEAPHITEGCIRASHIQRGAIGSDCLTPNSFGLEHLQDCCIESRHLVKHAVSAFAIAPGSIEEYHVSGGWDPCRIFRKGVLTGEWFQEGSIEGKYLAKQTITGTHIKHQTVRFAHLCSSFQLPGSHLLPGTLQTEHFTPATISASILKPQSGEPNLFAPHTLPGWVLQPQSLHGGELIQFDTLTKRNLSPTDRGFRIQWKDASLWSPQTSNYVELGGTLTIQLSENYTVWEQRRHPEDSPRSWVPIRSIQGDIIIGDAAPFERISWDERAMNEDWSAQHPEQKKRWNQVRIYGDTETRGTWTHRGTLECKGVVKIQKVDDALQIAQEAQRYAYYDSCPLGSIVVWRGKKVLPRGWEETTELPEPAPGFIWIEKTSLGLVAEEFVSVDATMIEEAADEESNNKN